MHEEILRIFTRRSSTVDPEVDHTTEFDARVDAVVAEMRALNISKILITQDTVEIGVGYPPTATGILEFPNKENND